MKSPLKDKPLRNPGDSTRKILDEFIFDKVLSHILFALIMILLAFMEWYRYLWDSPPNPWALSAVALFAVMLAIYKVIKGIPIIRNMRLGSDGERAVGQYLESLREMGAKVFHDIPAKGFNIDSPGGCEWCRHRDSWRRGARDPIQQLLHPRIHPAPPPFAEGRLQEGRVGLDHGFILHHAFGALCTYFRRLIFRNNTMPAFPTANLGRTGLPVTKLGYGAMELRGVDHFPRLTSKEASTLLNSVLDTGINHIFPIKSKACGFLSSIKIPS